MNKLLLITLISSLIFAGCNTTSTTDTSNANDSVASDTVEDSQPEESPSDQNATPPEDAVVYEVNSEKTTLEWTGRMGPKSHTGKVPVNQGSVWMTEEVLGGSFTIDMANLEADGTGVGDHLKSDDFFDVETHPEAEFVITSVEPDSVSLGEPGSYQVTGDLTIKGITNEISFEAEVAEEANEYTLVADFTIDRSKWDVRYGSASFFDDLGDKVIADEIEFSLNLVLDKPSN